MESSFSKRTGVWINSSWKGTLLTISGYSSGVSEPVAPSPRSIPANPASPPSPPRFPFTPSWLSGISLQEASYSTLEVKAINKPNAANMAVEKKFSDVVDEFSDFIKDKKLIIHNANFDLSHLNNELAILGKNKINSQNVIDTLELARSKFPGAQNSLDALCKRFKIDNSKRVKHTALVDCELLSKVYVNLTGQKEPTLNLKIGENNIEREDNKKKIQYYNMVIKPTDEEVKLHKKFLKTKLKKNFF